METEGFLAVSIILAFVGVWVFCFSLQKRVEKLEAMISDQPDYGVEEVDDVKDHS